MLNFKGIVSLENLHRFAEILSIQRSMIKISSINFRKKPELKSKIIEIQNWKTRDETAKNIYVSAELNSKSDEVPQNFPKSKILEKKCA